MDTNLQDLQELTANEISEQYETRDGRAVNITSTRVPNESTLYPIVGYIENSMNEFTWTPLGYSIAAHTKSNTDLVRKQQTTITDTNRLDWLLANHVNDFDTREELDQLMVPKVESSEWLTINLDGDMFKHHTRKDADNSFGTHKMRVAIGRLDYYADGTTTFELEDNEFQPKEAYPKEAKELKALRKEMKLGQTQLENMLGIPHTYVSRFERGVYVPIVHKRKILDYMNQ